MTFKQFADKINAKFLQLAETGTLLKTNVPKEQLWETYQNAYPEKYNPIFRERREHDCQTCYSFVKRVGALVAISDNKQDTIWNVQGLETPYKEVAEAMHNLVSTSAISSVFLTDESTAGKEFNIEETESGEIRWDHFYADIDQAYISQQVATDRGNIETTVSVFSRALTEFTESALIQVIDLCDSIYKGEEFQPTVSKFLTAKRAYEASSNKSAFIWTEYKNYPAKIRNTAIGTLIIDINEGVDLETAVAKYEKVVAPSNYKRTTAVVTEGMKKQAKETIQELNLENSLPRRHATLTDISVNNVLFSDHSAQAVMKDTLDDLLDSTVTKAPQKASSNCVEVSIENFLSDVLPNSTTIEALVENKHTVNLVSLVAPVNPEAPNMLKWDNNFSWSYAGEVTDSMKERVEAAGGSVTGDLRFSIQWNESGKDGHNDLDAHCVSPKTHINFSDKKGRCGGQLDVDITNPSSQTKDGTAVENITWASHKTMPDGHYQFYVKNYSGKNTKGFRAQIAILGEIFEYSVDKSVTSNVTVAVVTLKNGEFTISHLLTPTSTQKTKWDVTTKEYKKVSTIMLSPNFWNNQAIGNKHYFFMLDGCTNPDPVRGFYNEFLSEDLRPHRKVFEVLSSRMKCTPTKEQLSGLGFSSSQRNDLVVKVDNRQYKIIF